MRNGLLSMANSWLAACNQLLAGPKRY